MEKTLRELQSRFDIVIIDTPPLLSVTDAAVLSTIAGGTALVVGAGRVDRDHLAKSLQSLEAVKGRVLGLVLNMLPTKGEDQGRRRLFLLLPRGIRHEIERQPCNKPASGRGAVGYRTR